MKMEDRPPLGPLQERNREPPSSTARGVWDFCGVHFLLWVTEGIAPGDDVCQSQFHYAVGGWAVSGGICLYFERKVDLTCLQISELESVSI